MHFFNLPLSSSNCTGIQHSRSVKGRFAVASIAVLLETAVPVMNWVFLYWQQTSQGSVPSAALLLAFWYLEKIHAEVLP